MIGNKPSIYNAQSVYNQGGGSGTFDVDLGGGVSQTIVFPPYLVPVEFIDSSNYTGSGLCILGASQIEKTNDYKIKTKIAPNKLSMGANDEQILKICSAFKSSDSYYYYNVKLIPNSDSITIQYANNSHQFDYLDFGKEMIIGFDCSSRTQSIKYVNGQTISHQDSRSFGYGNFGTWSFFNSFSISSGTMFRGKLYGTILYKLDEIKALFVPARAKNQNDTKPYIVDCVSGSVGVNCGDDSTTNGLTFGPDIDLSEEIPGWIT